MEALGDNAIAVGVGAIAILIGAIGKAYFDQREAKRSRGRQDELQVTVDRVKDAVTANGGNSEYDRLVDGIGSIREEMANHYTLLHRDISQLRSDFSNEVHALRESDRRAGSRLGALERIVTNLKGRRQ